MFHLSFSAQTDQVLFVGNSMTFSNNMPDLFKNIAESKGKTVNITSHTVGGTGFVDHVNNSSLYQTIRSRVYDYVVLQPGTGESAGVTHPVSVTAERGKKIRDSIRKYSPCSKIFLYEIPYGVPSANDYATYFTYQQIIKDSITKMSNLMHAEMIPAGESARAHYTVSPDLSLHPTYNDVHPNLNGSYMVAASVYSAIYQQPSFPSAYWGGLSQATAEYYQQTSGSTVLTNPSQWLLNVYHTNVDFSTSGNGQQIAFTNSSSNYDSVFWDFGDGTTSVAIDPAHQYLLPGIYQVTLTVSKNGCSYAVTKTVSTDQLNVSESLLTELKIYPNPAYNVLNVKSIGTKANYKIYNSVGQLILDGLIQDNKIDISKLVDGLYVLEIENNGQFVQKKFIKQNK